jgi:hypothetical protein
MIDENANLNPGSHAPLFWTTHFRYHSWYQALFYVVCLFNRAAFADVATSPYVFKSVSTGSGCLDGVDRCTFCRSIHVPYVLQKTVGAHAMAINGDALPRIRLFLLPKPTRILLHLPPHQHVVLSFERMGKDLTVECRLLVLLGAYPNLSIHSSQDSGSSFFKWHRKLMRPPWKTHEQLLQAAPPGAQAQQPPKATPIGAQIAAIVSLPRRRTPRHPDPAPACPGSDSWEQSSLRRARALASCRRMQI